LRGRVAKRVPFENIFLKATSATLEAERNKNEKVNAAAGKAQTPYIPIYFGAPHIWVAPLYVIYLPLRRNLLPPMRNLHSRSTLTYPLKPGIFCRNKSCETDYTFAAWKPISVVNFCKGNIRWKPFERDKHTSLERHFDRIS
jgi:hypothetical protein